MGKVLKGLSQTKDIEQMGGHLGKASYKVGILPYYLMAIYKCYQLVSITLQILRTMPCHSYRGQERRFNIKSIHYTCKLGPT